MEEGEENTIIDASIKHIQTFFINKIGVGLDPNCLNTQPRYTQGKRTFTSDCLQDSQKYNFSSENSGNYVITNINF